MAKRGLRYPWCLSTKDTRVKLASLEEAYFIEHWNYYKTETFVRYFQNLQVWKSEMGVLRSADLLKIAGKVRCKK